MQKFIDLEQQAVLRRMETESAPKEVREESEIADESKPAQNDMPPLSKKPKICPPSPNVTKKNVLPMFDSLDSDSDSDSRSDRQPFEPPMPALGRSSARMSVSQLSE